MTFTLDLETEITAHFLPKGILQVKYEPNQAKGREDMLRTNDLGQTEEGQKDKWMQTDGQTD